VVRLPQEEQHRKRLPHRRQYEMQLLQEEQPMAEWTQGEQCEV
jgi:serine phosphatase RsbU (regulator of sigma subunit)